MTEQLRILCLWCISADLTDTQQSLYQLNR